MVKRDAVGHDVVNIESASVFFGCLAASLANLVSFTYLFGLVLPKYTIAMREATLIKRGIGAGDANVLTFLGAKAAAM